MTIMTRANLLPMPLPTEVARDLDAHGIAWRPDEPLQKKTWWRVGGSADAWIEAGDASALRSILAVSHATGTPLFVMGNASNLLVSDRGIRGIVVRLVGALATADDAPDGTVQLGGGLKLVALIKRAERAGWTGLELFAGIPGTIGGAVRMNAGTALGEVADRLVDVTLALPDGTVRTEPRDRLAMSYRHGGIPADAIVVAARFSLTGADPAHSRALVEEHLAYRARTQPIDVPTCGSTFRNPPGAHAGKLIEQCGLKGHTIGGAQVSPKHANFLVNTGTATATDLRRLIAHVAETVQRETGIALEPEVHLAGDWSD
jgi:UDP-N-acetylmuramate dehydrogenase